MNVRQHYKGLTAAQIRRFNLAPACQPTNLVDDCAVAYRWNETLWRMKRARSSRCRVAVDLASTRRKPCSSAAARSASDRSSVSALLYVGSSWLLCHFRCRVGNPQHVKAYMYLSSPTYC